MSLAPATSVEEHYQRALDVYETLGTLGDGDLLALGNRDFTGWYWSPPTRRAGDVPPGYDGRARCYALTPDREKLTRDAERSIYLTANYTTKEFLAKSWDAYKWTDDGREWLTDAPTPGYGDIEAYAPLVDIDLSSEVKQRRPEGDVPTALIEDATERYIAAFAELGGGKDAVHVLDSVGGVYVLLAPTTTAPIADAFDGDERAQIFQELTSRLNEWVETLGAEIAEDIPDVEGVFEPDLVNHRNRLFKAPLAVHKRLDGVVMPMDIDAPEYDYTPLERVTSAEIDRAREWAESYTADYSEHVRDVVAMLWTKYYGKTDDWRAALQAWLDDKAKAAEDAAKKQAVARRSRKRASAEDDSSRMAPIEEVYQAIDRLNIEAVAEDTIVAGWNDSAGTSAGKRAFYPTWDPNCNGTANYINMENGVWHDTGEDNHGTAIEMALYASPDVSWTRGDIANGDDWTRGLEELRKLGYDIPLPKGDAGDRSAYYGLSLKSIARETVGDATDLYDDRAKLLKVCLHARDDYDSGLVDETPPYKVLVEVAERTGLSFKDDDEKILGQDSHRLAQIVYDDMTAEDVGLGEI